MTSKYIYNLNENETNRERVGEEMNKNEAKKRLAKFKGFFGYHDDIERWLYWIELYIDRLYADGFEIKSNLVDIEE